MRRSRLLRILTGGAAALAMLMAAACGGDDDNRSRPRTEADPTPTATAEATAAETTPTPASTATETATPEPATATPSATEAARERVALHIGLLVPETGALASLAVPAVEAMKLAVADIDAAGGNITVTMADTATDSATGQAAVAQVLAEGADVVVGPFTSEVTGSVIQRLFEERVPQCTPSAQFPTLSTQENSTYFFRTIQPAQAIAPLTARIIVEDGATRIAVIDRDTGYGGELMATLFRELGVESRVILYDSAATTFEAEVAAIVEYNPDAILNFGFFLAGTSITRDLIEAGFGPEMQYGGDALLRPFLWQHIDPDDPTVIDGMRFIGIAGRDEFNARISAITGGSVTFAAQSYDCVVLMALAAEIAGGTDGDAIMEALEGLTHDGVECFSYEACVALIHAGEDIDYVGASGPLNFTPDGDPTVGTYAVFQFEDGRIATIETHEVDLAESR